MAEADSPKPKSAGRSARALPWLRPFLLAVLLVAVPGLFFWWFYLGQQSAGWQKLALSALHAAAQTTKVGLERQALLLEGAKSVPNWIEGVEAVPCRAKPGRFSIAGAQLALVVPHEPGVCLRQRMSLEKAVAWQIASDRFDYLLLTDGSDKKLATDNRLARHADEEFFRREGDSLLLRVEEPDEAADAGPANASWWELYAFRLTTLPRVETLGAQFVVFKVPVELQVGEGPESAATSLRLVGLVSADRIRAESLSLSSVALIRIAALVAATFLVLPYLKIRFMGRRERLHAHDLWLLAVAALIAIGGATILVVHSYGLARAQARADAKLVSFSQEVTRIFAEEIALARRQLVAAAPQLAGAGRRYCGGVLSRNAVCEPGGAGVGPIDDLGTYPFFEALGLADWEAKRQVRKLMPRDPPTELVSVEQYQWPEKARALPRDSTDSALQFVSASTTGLPLVVLALPARSDAGRITIGTHLAPEERNAAAFIGMEPLSLRAPAVPFPFDFAVVMESGELAYHSGSAGWPGENFLDGFDHPELLRSALDLGVESSPTEYRYVGRMHRMVTRPLPRASLTLVAFYDKREIEDRLQLVVLSGLAWLVMLVLLLGIAMAAIRGAESQGFEWAWPTAKRTPSYLIGLGAWLLFGFALLGLRRVLPEPWVPYLILGAPVVALVLLSSRPAEALVARVDSGALAERLRSRWYPWAYVAFGTAGLLAVVALPVGIAAFDALAAGDALYEARGRAVDAARLKRREQDTEIRYEFEADLPQVGAGPGPLETLAAEETIDQRSRRGERESISVQKAYTEPVQTLERAFGSYIPRADSPASGEGEAAPVVPRCGALFTGGPSALPRSHFSIVGLWCWAALFGAEPGWRSAVAQLAAAAPSKGGPATDPSGGFEVRLLWLALPLLLLYLGVRAFVRSVGQRILGLDLEGDGVIDRSADVSRPGPRHWLLLRPDSGALGTIRKRLEIEGAAVDLRDESKPASIAPDALAADRPIVVDHVERRLADPEWRKALLALISAPRKEPLLLVSALDPLYFLVGRAREGTASAEDWLEIQRWAAALQRVERVRFQLPTEAVAEEKDQKRAPLSPSLSDRLAEECRWSPRLREIEADLRKRSDLDRFQWPDLIDYLLDAAEPHYRELWGLCSLEERLVLRQLAEEGLVNPHCFDLLRRLRRRRLVRIDPRIRLAGESLRRFVLEAEDPGTIRSWELLGESSARVRGPLLAVGFVVAGVFVATMGPQVGQAVSLAAASGSLLTAVATVWSNVRKVQGTA